MTLFEAGANMPFKTAVILSPFSIFGIGIGCLGSLCALLGQIVAGNETGNGYQDTAITANIIALTSLIVGVTQAFVFALKTRAEQNRLDRVDSFDKEQYSRRIAELEKFLGETKKKAIVSEEIVLKMATLIDRLYERVDASETIGCSEILEKRKAS